MSAKPIELAILGDLHGSWDGWDAQYFNDSDYAMLLFTGDLGSGTAKNGVAVARSVARLNKPALVMPGNNDAPFLAEIDAELNHQMGLIALMEAAGGARGSLVGAQGRATLCGFSVHDLPMRGHRVSLVACRPLAMGGGSFSFGDIVARRYGVADLDASAARLCELVDSATHETLIFLGHNGPHGLGGAKHDLWGCDFDDAGGDWGDPDMASAIEYARSQGRRVAGVIAGHMHHNVRGGGARKTQHQHAGTQYCNPARVPRIEPGNDDVYRHHHVLRVHDDGTIEFFERRIPEYG